MVTLAVFRPCENAPSGYVNDRVYRVSKRSLNFRWFHKAPEGSKEGDMLQGPVITPILPPEQPPEEELQGDLTIDLASLEAGEMEFRGGRNAHAGHKVGDKVILPLRYARFKWFKRVR